MSSTTDSDSTEDFGIPFRRPISVAQLLEREGFRPAARTRATRRALTGVAAGAVLTVGAVVGSLFLNHGQTAPRDTLASGSQSGGDIVLSEGNQQGTIVSPAMPHKAGQPAAVAPAAPSAAGHGTDGGDTGRAKGAVGNAPIAAAPQVATAPATPARPSTPTVQSAPVLAPASTPASTSTSPTANSSTATAPSAPAATPTTTPAASTPATTTPPATTDPAAPPTSESAAPTTTPAPAHTGLLGGLAGLLGHVEHPAFNWFG